jgi:hypothetical protein
MDGKRSCYYLTSTMLTPEGYLPVVVVEGCAWLRPAQRPTARRPGVSGPRPGHRKRARRRSQTGLGIGRLDRWRRHLRRRVHELSTPDRRGALSRVASGRAVVVG